MNVILFLPFPKGSNFQLYFEVLNLQCSQLWRQDSHTTNTQHIPEDFVRLCACVKCTSLKTKLFSSSFFLSIDQSWTRQKLKPKKKKKSVFKTVSLLYRMLTRKQQMCYNHYCPFISFLPERKQQSSIKNLSAGHKRKYTLLLGHLTATIGDGSGKGTKQVWASVAGGKHAGVRELVSLDFLKINTRIFVQDFNIEIFF